MNPAETKKVFIRNLVFLMSQEGMRYADIDKLRDKPCSGQYVGMLVRGERTPTIEILSGLANTFNLNASDLLNPTLPEEYAVENNLAEVVKHYLDANDEGRKHILSSAAIAPKK
tara:strand:- start:23 stop:364 length:342 start_codon:yes stop_codon:yes gene_type:complete